MREKRKTRITARYLKVRRLLSSSSSLSAGPKEQCIQPRSGFSFSSASRALSLFGKTSSSNLILYLVLFGPISRLQRITYQIPQLPLKPSISPLTTQTLSSYLRNLVIAIAVSHSLSFSTLSSLSVSVSLSCPSSGIDVRSFPWRKAKRGLGAQCKISPTPTQYNISLSLSLQSCVFFYVANEQMLLSVASFLCSPLRLVVCSRVHVKAEVIASFQ